MLTRMTDEDWATVLEVFRACRSRRGAKGRTDRLFLEALHDFAVHNITWRALPKAFGNWNSVWKRFWRLSRAGVFEAFFQALAGLSRTAHLVQMFDSSVVRAHVSAAKMGLVGLARSLASEWGRHGIRVNAIAPGYMRTERTAPYFENVERTRLWFEMTPLGKKYPSTVKAFRDAWERFIPFLAFPPALRRVIDTTNSSESLNY